MTIHLLGLPHTETTREYEWCAFTAKTRKFATMLKAEGHEVILYAGEANEADATEHVPVVTRAEQREWFGRYNWSRDVFNEFDPMLPWWLVMNGRTIWEIKKRAKPGDILAITMGGSQKQVADALPELVPVEVGVGYSGVWAPYRVYESHAWRNYIMGRYHANDDQVRFYDEVIPNFFEPEAFPMSPRGDYFLYIGRLIHRKGITVAADACRRLGAKLLVAGQGAAKVEPGRITCLDGSVIEGDVEYVGVAGPDLRARLMGAAHAVFVPTLYLEPFGGVSVEAQMTGTPAIVSPSGGLVENVEPEWVCSTLAEFVEAAERSTQESQARRWIRREEAIAGWSLDAIGPRYTRYLSRIDGLQGAGWGA